ncbi:MULTISPECIES: type IV-A pilus assembly ATPase PilB [Psychrilyobacter]|uniref:Type IV-A pilus assembly ATPase PilB n=1 Tax=Psychrilyobacter piezotolerans TaxID=2293438 RepID=A0ABX9KEY1_9FUSO|nr:MULTISPECIES: type IV-A pilus assembly ATPase PilB [Psychrilyobacter]MCS5421541.1 type IV-A pilus assembly ATPase PilB [Psychrilyobacter sp. S5]NDI78664.1 type IV-A pilus assembly ATPase PilB [Psychrilyobacter piezotolerans]RDE60016.1 type IV-A pilus assembly ATPase PilB [Psychrilyobacter sp. S5]REI40243.1 type IV-A pilus assembly ATPase PilB [Psychrilyobacter piezotolerans]
MVVVKRRMGIGEILIEKKLITRDALEKALEEQKKTGEKLGEILIEMGYLDEENMLGALGEQNKVNVKVIDEKDLKLDVLAVLPEEYMREKIVLPLRINGKKLMIAMENPKDTFLIDELQMKTNMVIKPVLAMKSNIMEYLGKYIHKRDEKTETQTDSVLDELNKFAEEDIEIESNYKDEDIVSSLGSDSAPVVKGVNAIIVKAVKLQASDIHIEPYDKEIRIRYRLDGLLITVKKMPKHIMNAIVSRIKIMCDLDIAEKRLPQDGRFRIKMGDRQVDFRVSTLKTIHGEKVVMRILDRGSVKLDLSSLGYNEKALEIINRVIQNPYGIILVTGPTGSGKSTTLYSILDKLNQEHVNISTAEDPVEYELEGINQVQCKPDIGLTFAASLRSFLRQDPDIIMVGEIRDGETAEISIKAALTGHLVLSTLHTNDAPSSIHRLLNMGVEPFLISASISMVIAQRLVRKICPHCIGKDGEAANKLMAMDLNKNDYEGMSFQIGSGCGKCNNTGYKGRSVIYEIMEVDDEMKNLISGNTTSIEIKDLAVKKGMDTLRESGMKKAILGVTSLDEVMRVTLS